MSLKRRQFTREFKLQVIRDLAAGKSLAQVSREYQVHSGTLVAWRNQYEQYGEAAFQGNGHAYTQEAKIAELERIIGQLTVENTLLKKALNRLQEQNRLPAENGSGR